MNFDEHGALVIIYNLVKALTAELDSVFLVFDFGLKHKPFLSVERVNPGAAFGAKLTHDWGIWVTQIERKTIDQHSCHH